MSDQSVTVDIASFSNVEAEAALIGALMIDNTIVGDIREKLKPEHFYEPLHARLYSAILKFVGKGRLANPVTLKVIFQHDPALKELGGLSYLAKLTGSGASVIGARDFAAQIIEMATIRRIAKGTLSGLQDYVVTDGGDFEKVLSSIEASVVEVQEIANPVERLNIADMATRVLERHDTVVEGGTPGIKNRLVPDVDSLIGPLEPQQMTILAGRPGMGKSTTADSLALGYALNGAGGAFMFAESSAEMWSLKTMSNILHAIGHRIPFANLKKALLDKQERAAIEQARQLMETMPLAYFGIGRADIRRVEATIVREKRRLEAAGRKMQFCVVDYLQLLSAEGRHRPNDNIGRIAAVSEGLLHIAQKHDLHMIALSQLSRAVESRDDKRPRLADLRESGRLEEDADNVLMVYRAEYYLEGARPGPTAKDGELADWELDMTKARGVVELIAAKTRFGQTGSRPCRFIGDHSAVRGSGFIDGEEGAENLFGESY